MLWVVFGLGALVVFLARRAPADPNAALSKVVGPDTSLPALGVVTALSPAMSGGKPGIAYQNEIRLNTNYMMAPQKIVSEASPARYWQNRSGGLDDTGNYPTNANSSEWTGDVSTLTPSANSASTQKL